jgi:hypothetical protein
MGTGKEPKELSDLEPLEDLEELEHVPDLDDVPDLGELSELGEVPELGDAPEIASLEELEELEGHGDAAPSDGGAQAPSGPRELEKAPLMLQKAALILTLAALLPWLAPGGWVIERVLAKVVIALGGYVLYMGVLHSHDETVPGPFAKIGAMHAQALTALGAILMLLGVSPLIDSELSLTTIVEKAAVAIGLVTWCQVAAYAKGGKFNPMFGLIIPIFALAALGRLATVFANFDVFALLGSAGVAAAGGLAGYTMFLAMKDAKEHGKRKKKAQMEARKKARKQKKKN